MALKSRGALNLMGKNTEKSHILRPILVCTVDFFDRRGVLRSPASWARLAAPVNDWSDHTKAPKSAYQTSLAAGSSATDLLKGDNFAKVAVEIQSVRGYAPDPQAITHLQRFLVDRLNKPGGVTITNTGSLPSKATPATGTAGGSASSERVPQARRPLPPRPTRRPTSRSLENITTADGIRAQRSVHGLHSVSRRSLYWMRVLTATSEDTPAKQAATPRSRFSESYAPRVPAFAANPAIQPWVLEATTMEHEFGRLLGLVLHS